MAFAFEQLRACGEIVEVALGALRRARAEMQLAMHAWGAAK
jgi:hypothetical protein